MNLEHIPDGKVNLLNKPISLVSMLDESRELCHRCGKTETRHMLDGKPTCGPCQARLQALSEEKVKCPVDGEVMKKMLISKRVIVDKCPKCEGVWLDKGELGIIQYLCKSKPDADRKVIARMLGRSHVSTRWSYGDG